MSNQTVEQFADWYITIIRQTYAETGSVEATVKTLGIRKEDTERVKQIVTQVNGGNK